MAEGREPLDPLARFEAARGQDPEKALFFWSGGPTEVAPGTWFQSVFSGSTAFETDAGLVLVDSGTVLAAPTMAARLRERTRLPIHTAIFTHGHVDHAHGLRAFLLLDQPPPRVIAHRAVLERFRRYEQTRRHNQAVNARQFGGTVEAAAGGGYDLFRTPDLPPTVLYEDHLTIEVGGLGFELHHCRGETDDHTWVYCPERGVLCSGDLFISCVPNAGNPQKAQRYPWDWAAGLRAMAARGARTLCPGHGGPIVDDPEKVRRVLIETAEYLEALVRATLEALEDGSPPHVDIVHRVPIPRSAAPWLQPVYDEGEFIVRNVIRYYGGWWSGRPSELKPAPRAALAREVAALAGGARALLARARTLAEAGDFRLACHLADYALEAAAEDPAVRQGVAELYRERAATETSLMAVNLFRSAAAYAEAGRAFV